MSEDGTTHRAVNINQVPPGPANQGLNLRRPLHAQYPKLGDIPIQFSKTNTYYDAVTARFTGHFTKYVDLYAAYAHGRRLSDGNNISPADLSQYYGPTAQDIAHIFKLPGDGRFAVRQWKDVRGRTGAGSGRGNRVAGVIEDV